MDSLIRFGFTIDEIKLMMDTNQDIEYISDNSILKLIDVLYDVGFSDVQIKNIFLSNPFFISRDYQEIIDLVNKFKELDVSNLIVLFDSNPYILNYTCDDIEKFYQDKLKKGLKNDNILDYFYTNIVF